MLQKTKDITPLEYAKYRGWTLQNVTKHLRKGNSLHGVIKVKTFSRFYLLEVDQSLNAQSFTSGKINSYKKRKK